MDEEKKVRESQLLIKMPEASLTKPELLNITKKFLEGGRRYFGEGAIGLKNQLNDPAYKEFEIDKKLVQAGISGEIATSNALRKWIYDKPNVVLVDSIHLPLGEENQKEFDEEEKSVNVLGDTDHLLIIGPHIILIDSKNWKERASYSVSETGEVKRQNKPFPGNKPHVNASKQLWKKFYSDIPRTLDIQAFVCISNEKSTVIRDRNWWMPGWKLVNQLDLIKFLDKFYFDENKFPNEDLYIDVDLVAKAITGLQKPYNAFKEKYPIVYKTINRGS